MKRFLRITLAIIIDAVRAIDYFITNNLRNFAWLLNFILPYLMYLVGQNVCASRGYLAVGGELLIPIIFCVIIYYLRSYANKIGKGTTIPVPDKRFTEVDDDGEVSIPSNRIQELILYLADLEDWLERKGLL
jgi:hypothetical protein